MWEKELSWSAVAPLAHACCDMLRCDKCLAQPVERDRVRVRAPG